MATADELLSTVSTEVNRTFVIDGDLRTIIIPKAIKNLGVESDDDVMLVPFRMPSEYCGIDLSTFDIKINYLNAAGEPDLYDVTDSKRVGGVITFSWLVGRHAAMYKGDVTFNVCMKDVSATGEVLREFNTTPAILPILEGLEVGEQVILEYADILEQWKATLFGSGDTVEAQITAASQAHQQAIAAKGEETLATIPEDYTETYRMAEEALRTKADAIALEASGKASFVDDATNDSLLGLTIYGKTSQVRTTGKNQVDMSGFEFNDSNYTHMLAQGESESADAFYAFLKAHTGENIMLSMETTGEASGIDIGTIRFYDANSDLVCSIVPNFMHTVLTLPDTYGLAYIYGSTNGASVKNIQVEFGDEVTDYEPYSGGIASPSPDWPQPFTSIENPTFSIYGKNLINRTLGVTTNAGITYTPNEDGTITINGTATAPSYYTFDFNNEIPVHDVELVLSIKGGAGKTSITTGYFDSDGRVVNSVAYAEDGEMKFSYPDSAVATRTFITVGKGTTCENVVVYPMIRLATADDEFEKQKTAQELSIPYTLSGIPVESGGNFTDSTGQQWISDEVDFERGVFIQRIQTVQLDGTEDITREERYGGTYRFNIVPNTPVRANPYPGGYCSHFEYDLGGPIGNNEIDRVACVWTNGRIYCRYDTITFANTMSAWLAHQHTNGTPFTMKYVLETPVETPLTIDEINAYKALRSNYHNSTFINDITDSMVVKYSADTLIFLRDNQPRPTNEQVEEAVNAYLDDRGVQVPSDEYIKGLVEDTVSEMDLSIDVDSALNEVSENPVQNKVIAHEINTMKARVLPTVSSSDDGKLLKVVGGAWAAVTITDGNEVAY